MKKTLVVAASLSACLSAHATVSASTEGGTSYVHLGKLSTVECKALVSSPVVAGIKVAVDGRIMSADDVMCREGAKIDLVSDMPVVKISPTGVTSWPLAKSKCVAMAVKLLAKGPIRVNGAAVTQVDQVEPACSKSSNSVTAPIGHLESEGRKR
ncbi:hypothetical protein [Cupriavidus sp. USMAA2-4]|uniref:hypothetical protein n=1 Tax=Cupriavidus sp. USMAA2-4 TaxID=876364 RepID=UPI0012F4DBF6|nr:hypothetical protein [Cupriavidus sp. USMAA2-4]